MKFLTGVCAGAALMWLYSSERARGARQRLESAPAWFQQAGQLAVSGASSSAQRVSEMIDAAPIPGGVKSTASDVAFNAWATAESLSEQQSRADPEARPGAGSESLT